MKLIILVTTMLLSGFAFGGDCDGVTPCDNCTCDETVEECTGDCCECEAEECDVDCTCECENCDHTVEVIQEEFHCGGGGCGGGSQ